MDIHSHRKYMNIFWIEWLPERKYVHIKLVLGIRLEKSPPDFFYKPDIAIQYKRSLVRGYMTHPGAVWPYLCDVLPCTPILIRILGIPECADLM